MACSSTWVVCWVRNSLVFLVIKAKQLSLRLHEQKELIIKILILMSIMWWTDRLAGDNQELNYSKDKLELVVLYPCGCVHDSLRASLRLRVGPGEMTGTAGCHLQSRGMKNHGRMLGLSKVVYMRKSSNPAPILGGLQWRAGEEPKADLAMTSWMNLRLGKIQTRKVVCQWCPCQRERREGCSGSMYQMWMTSLWKMMINSSYLFSVCYNPNCF